MTAGVAEIAIGFEFLYATLSGDATLAALVTGGWWHDMAPAGTATPFGIMGLQSAPDTLTATATRLLAQPLYQVKVVGPASLYPSLVTAASRVDALLARTAGSAGGFVIQACYRDGGIALPELVDGVLWSNLGGSYRLLISS